MSRYKVGQKLSVICESIDENGKAKFRVVEDEMEEGLFSKKKNSEQELVKAMCDKMTDSFNKIAMNPNCSFEDMQKLMTDEMNKLIDVKKKAKF